MPGIKHVLGAMALLLAPLGAMAQSPVVVELFTSQGCSSCPPADRLLARLARQENVIALALHVDYWDYLGWADAFAQPQFSDRQRAYARAWRERSVYTPQMVVQGVSYMVGSRGEEIARHISLVESQPPLARVVARSHGQGLQLELIPLGGPAPEADIHLVRYGNGETVAIRRGENAGKTIEYVNVVQSWETLGRWDGTAPTVVNVPMAEAGDYVVILQAPGPGQIYAATRLRH